jgi:hypothetical protein
MDEPVTGSLHHVELWMPDLGRAVQQWGWLLGRLGYEPFQDWDPGTTPPTWLAPTTSRSNSSPSHRNLIIR